ncbi:MAG: hypothetical protein AAF572_21895 [Cyanobacteria bacterium P01_B01_bin.77]
MVYSPLHQSSKSVFNEVVIANFGPFQIAILTTTQLVKRQIFSADVPVPERIYQTQGWLICNQQLIANLYGLQISPIFSEDGPFNPLRRLAPSVPLSFEVKSSQALPTAITKQATFACELQGTNLPYHTIFRNVSPHFVRIYPFGQRMTLLRNVQQLLEDESSFVTQNRERLRQVPFFQTRFGL